jgi:hypothetical protein
MLTDLLRRIIIENGGFMRDTDVAELAKLDRLRQVLVRCGNGRFVTAADSVAHFIGIIERERGDDGEDGSDYVRDVSLLASDAAYRGDYRPCTTTGMSTTYKPAKAIAASRKPDSYVNNFREEDCGGAFDGFCVTSDADPGL